MRVIFTPAAERQVERLYRYIADQASEQRAADYVERIVAHCRGLANFPERGTRRDDILPGLRIVGFERRITIALLVEPGQVVIQGVLYGGRNYEVLLKDAQ